MEKGEKKVRVSSIFIYPVRSCWGFSVSHAPITPTGFRWDRQWLVVNKKGRMYTQRVEPKLAIVAVELPSDAFSESWQPTANSSLASDYRPVDPTYASGHRVMFSDQYTYMLLSQGSLDALNRLLKEPISINRFRPNILVDGCDPFLEDLWTEIRIAEFTFRGVKLCSRCKVPTINQETGLAGQEPNETLKKFRSDKALRPE